MIVVGDCREVMAGMEPDSVDAIVTDPPYGLEFMGKEWDRLGATVEDCSIEGDNFATQRGGSLPFGGNGQRVRYGVSAASMQAWHESWAREAFRILKPGGHLLAFGGSRTYHRMACAVEDAGFEIRDQIQYLYGSGFPKSHSVSKALDKLAGHTRGAEPDTRNGPDTNRASKGDKYSGGYTNGGSLDNGPVSSLARQWDGWGTALKPAHEPIVVARKPLIGTVAANVERYGTGAINVDGCRIGPNAGWSYPNGRGGEGWHGRKSLGRNLSEPMRATAGRWPANVCLDEEWIPVLALRDTLSDEAWGILSRWCYARNGEVPAMQGPNRRAAEPEEAEEVLHAELPVPLDVREQPGPSASDVRSSASTGVHRENAKDEAGKRKTRGRQSDLEAGLVHAARICDDNQARQESHPRAPTSNGAGVRQTTKAGRGRSSHQRDQVGQPTGEPGDSREADPQDETCRPVPRTAGASRPRCEVLLRDVPTDWLGFFQFTGDVVRVGAGRMLDEQSGERPGAISNGSSGKNPSMFNGGKLNQAPSYADRGGASRFFYCAKASRKERERGLNGDRCVHPTVKPVALMRWLVRLVTPPGGLVLDPFAGSGTTGIACVLEGFEFMGIEQDAEYAAIAEKRIAAVEPDLFAANSA